MNKVKISVLKKEFYPELADKYITDGKNIGSCPFYDTGDEFIYEGGAEMPEGFCPWAWIDIYRGVSSVSAGGTYTPWNIHEGTQILCCTDGVRPVIFKIEALTNDELR